MPTFPSNSVTETSNRQLGTV
ncbi:rCG42524, isoform CRA_a [Rattus norvegicus]|uniref:RCG42524, isoform CRA_a n=1 Tax=Rattus norvegicus TaxID=10116 RepID=A6K1R0_RAT|nr:rCG42524, isoform CRA_a [Rattus norvegicus]